jgi:hypothetical protein
VAKQQASGVKPSRGSTRTAKVAKVPAAKKPAAKKPAAKKPAAKKPAAAAPAKAAPVVAIAPPKRALAPAPTSIPPPPPAPPPPRDELVAPRDVGRLLRYGEAFGAHKIDARMLPLQLPSGSGALAVFDPTVAKSWRVLDRPVGVGQFRVMLSVARGPAGERLAAVVLHLGRPPIARWTVAHYQGQKQPRSADQLPRAPITSGWLALVDAAGGHPGTAPEPLPPASGTAPLERMAADGRRMLLFPIGVGELAAYWAVDAADHAICLVVDGEAFTAKDWRPAK